MKKITRFCIAITVSIFITFLYIQVTSNIRYSYVKYNNTSIYEGIEDGPSGVEKVGWPIPIYSREVGGMPSVHDISYYNKPIEPNLIATIISVFMVSIVTSIAIINKKNK